MEVVKNKQTLQLSFDSTAENIENANGEIRSFLNKQKNINHTVKQNVFVISEELIQNAYIHGNEKNAEKSISYALNMNGKEVFSISVEDEGKGYDVQKMQKNPPFDPKHTSRQGLILVNTLAKDVSFQNGGRKIVVTVSVQDTIQKLLQRSGKEHV